jgi:hypothetical protein
MKNKKTSLISEPTWPRNVTMHLKDIKSRAYCSRCGKRWERGLMESLKFSKAKFTEDSIIVPMEETPCTCENPDHHYYVGTLKYVTGDPTIPAVREELKKAGVKLLP